VAQAEVRREPLSCGEANLPHFSDGPMSAVLGELPLYWIGLAVGGVCGLIVAVTVEVYYHFGLAVGDYIGAFVIGALFGALYAGLVEGMPRKR
jgi:hypothetical protein